MKKTVILILLVCIALPVFADDALVLPAGVFRLSLAPNYAFVNGAYDTNDARILVMRHSLLPGGVPPRGVEGPEVVVELRDHSLGQHSPTRRCPSRSPCVPNAESKERATVLAEQHEVALVQRNRVHPHIALIAPRSGARGDAFDGEAMRVPISADLPYVDHSSRSR